MTDKTKQRALSPREEAMNAVSATRNADFTKETGIVIEANVATVDPDIDPEHAAAEAERARLQALADGRATGAADDDTAQAALQREQDEAAAAKRTQDEANAAREAEEATHRAQTAAGIDPKAKYTLKVNGRDVEVTGEEVLRRAQKDTAADQRLEEANRIMRDAQTLQQSLQEQQRVQAEADAARGKGGDPHGVAVDPNVTKKFTAALFKGDEEAAVTAFNEAVASAVAAAGTKGRGTTAATPIDPSAIAAQVRQQINIDSALEQSRKDYPALYSDPDIEAVAAARIQRMVTEGKPFVAALDEVQSGFAEKFGWKKAAGTPSPQPHTDRRDEKLARKGSLEQTPSGPAVKTASTEEPVQDVSAAIRDIAKSRGQSVVS